MDVKSNRNRTEVCAVDFRLTREEDAVSFPPYRLGSKPYVVFTHPLDGVPTLATGLPHILLKEPLVH